MIFFLHDFFKLLQLGVSEIPLYILGIDKQEQNSALCKPIINNSQASTLTSALC
jgi:hypothetical protein